MIDHLDHLVLTTFNEAACVDFYTPVPGALDLCFIASIPLDEVIGRLQGASDQHAPI